MWNLFCKGVISKDVSFSTGGIDVSYVHSGRTVEERMNDAFTVETPSHTSRLLPASSSPGTNSTERERGKERVRNGAAVLGKLAALWHVLSTALQRRIEGFWHI